MVATEFHERMHGKDHEAAMTWYNERPVNICPNEAGSDTEWNLKFEFETHMNPKVSLIPLSTCISRPRLPGFLVDGFN